ncbi:hypothetical protein B0H19DRAFT_230180 [Mycena capillaripes]|nr:hypothetical protein B0H19DRAFT_230180 [Mycena capillaripes]
MRRIYVVSIRYWKKRKMNLRMKRTRTNMPLPPSPGIQVYAYHDDEPPTPPPKLHLADSHAFSLVAARPPAPAEGRVHKILGAMKNTNRTRGKRGKAVDTSRMLDGDNYHSRTELRGEDLVTSPTASQSRSPNARRPREFLARSGLKPTSSRSKSRFKPASPRAGVYMYNGRALEILVSTQVTATRSAHDAGRPRVYYPRSSSLPAARMNQSLPPAPPEKNPPQSRSSRALPAVPSAGATNAPLNHSIDRNVGATPNAARPMRPLPVPVRSQASSP